ncbi:MAG: CDP-alcohol phosphatidyltransferase family protein [Bacteroidales bacterium]|nr:CDP-alcohol phosphatidyltransferase family protein [Bacteroidales bacterium]
MKNYKIVIPNTLTIINLLSGCIGIVMVFEEKAWYAIILMLIAALADVLDGLTAKLLNATSEFGKQLDSLSDLVSFGVLPSVFMYTLVKKTMFIEHSNIVYGNNILAAIIMGIPFLIAVFAALRLARFNIDTSQHTDFRGLPVPANALIVVSLWIFVNHPANHLFAQSVYLLYIYIVVVAFLSFLMISNLPMLSLKFKNLNFKENRWRYFLITGALALYLAGGISWLIYIMAYYILLSVVRHLVSFILPVRG